jgi:polyisoprenoid-binding protein YceI
VIEARRLLVTGDITLRAITNPVTFADTLNGAGRSKRYIIGFNGETTI